MFNSREYEWSDVTVVLAGRDVTGIRAVSYKSSQEKEALYAKGNKPHSIQRGNKAYEGSVTVLQSELQALAAAAKTAGGDILDLSFNIIVSYGNPSQGDVITTDLLRGCQITEYEKGLSQNDKFMEIELPLIAMDIKENYI